MQNMTSGVYKITNNITGDFYIGSSNDVRSRWAAHKSPSAHKRQPNSKLYKDMASYGLDNFTFEIIEKTDNLKEREQYYIEQLKPIYNNNWAQGLDIERRKETTRRYSKEWRKAHRDRHLAKMKDYNYTHRDEILVKSKDYYSRLCLYEGETLTLSALSKRFCRQGIPHPTLEAKKYLIVK